MINYEIPKEIRKEVLKIQLDLKIQTGNGKFSQQQTLNWIIKEYLKLKLNDNIKATCWKKIDLIEGETYYATFKRDKYGFTLNDREVYKAV